MSGDTFFLFVQDSVELTRAVGTTAWVWVPPKRLYNLLYDLRCPLPGSS